MPQAAISYGSLACAQTATASNRRQFESISANKSFRPHTCGRLGVFGAWWFWPRTRRPPSAAGGSDSWDHAVRLMNRRRCYSLGRCRNQ